MARRSIERDENVILRERSWFRKKKKEEKTLCSEGISKIETSRWNAHVKKSGASWLLHYRNNKRTSFIAAVISFYYFHKKKEGRFCFPKEDKTDVN